MIGAIMLTRQAFRTVATFALLAAICGGPPMRTFAQPAAAVAEEDAELARLAFGSLRGQVLDADAGHPLHVFCHPVISESL